MDSRLRRIFLSPLHLANALMGALLLASGGAAAEDSFAAMVEPQLERREVSEAAIDEENIELGAYYGIMSVEDFGSNSAWGVRAAYHIAEWGFVEGLYGQTTIGLTSYERLSGAVRLMSDAQRDTRYYYMTLGLNLLPGEGFLLGKAYNDSLYLSGGIGSTRFAGVTPAPHCSSGSVTGSWSTTGWRSISTVASTSSASICWARSRG